MKISFKILLTTFVLYLLSSCVSQSKYDEMVFKRDSLQHVSDSLLLLYKSSTDKNFSLNAEINALKAEIDRLKENSKQLKQNLESLKENSSKENKDLLDKLAEVEAEKLRIESLVQKKELKIAEIMQKLEAREKAMNALKEKLTKALLGFTEKGLSVSIKDGKVYVSLSNQLLFETGSTKIDSKGIEALKELSKVLQTQPELQILVEGHTDNQPVSGGRGYSDNWDLSVLRSTEVIRVLTESGVEPTRITASGKGEFYPINPNDTKEGKANNRRTEIILTPKLDELMDLIKSN
jgi:chemotaxis protein MotB